MSDSKIFWCCFFPMLDWAMKLHGFHGCDFNYLAHMLFMNQRLMKKGKKNKFWDGKGLSHNLIWLRKKSKKYHLTVDENQVFILSLILENRKHLPKIYLFTCFLLIISPCDWLLREQGKVKEYVYLKKITFNQDKNPHNDSAKWRNWHYKFMWACLEHCSPLYPSFTVTNW